MKDLKLSIYSSIIFIALYTILCIFFTPLLVKQFAISLLDNTYSSINKEALTLEYVYQSSEEKQEFPKIAQKTIANTETENAFLSIINWTGNIVSYPNVTKVGEVLVYDKTIDFGDDIDGDVLYDYFYGYFNTLKSNDEFEIVNLRPIKNSDLILVYNLNLKAITGKIDLVKQQAYFIFIIMGLFLLLLLITSIRVIGNYSAKIVDQKILNLEYNAKSLEKLNQSISSYQERLSKREQEEKENRIVSESSKEVSSEIVPEEISKQRILTYVRNELVSTLVTDIAYIYVESTITYIIRHDGRKTTSSDSLDKIYSMLKKEFFFKANRQFIVAISAIEKITKYENSKLKIQVKPKSEIDIIIGKNKASAFKQWLDL